MSGKAMALAKILLGTAKKIIWSLLKFVFELGNLGSTSLMLGLVKFILWTGG